ncbi:Serine/threonine-protein phosphatase 2A [Spironucleus salmonicida]|uniref:Serine/threonine-protein phosphatase 2A n=1 Tax=Spironucleus salmonicida TaxID=348837 RepID=V6LNI8_9EUKA|nr:Serine/threonine-protein phosphatase 2A [Spironucleus salmonicida]|eukprot:EST46160.1 Serine/threonine-protein phosphatase 2A [Spironucleus salmonicida]
MKVDKFQAIDNYMFEYLSSTQNFASILQSISSYKEPQHHVQKPKIPLSPQSPHSSLRSPNKLNIKDKQITDSQLISTQILQKQQIPYLLNDVFNPKTGVFGKFYFYKQVPQIVQQLENDILNFLKQCQQDNIIDLSLVVNNKFYLQELQIKEQFPGYFHHQPEESLTLLQLICESLFNIPVLLARLLFNKLNKNSLNHVKLSSASAPQYKQYKSLNFDSIVTYYNSIKQITSEERIIAIFGSNNNLSFKQIHMICLEVILFHPQFDFIQPFLYQNAFAYTCAARFFFDIDPQGQWIFNKQNFQKFGTSLSYIIYDIQSKPDISGENSIFGYEQFYVIYCLYAKYSNGDVTQNISEVQLKSFNQFTYSTRVINRVFNGNGRPLLNSNFAFADFIIFLLADAVFDSKTSCEFWFNICDVDSDGFIGQEDMKFYLKEQVRVWDRVGLGVQVQDVLRQIGDSIQFRFSFPNYFSLKELKSCNLHANFFDMLFSAQKFEQFESRDQYIGNVAIQDSGKGPVQHGQSAVWRTFWEAAYDDLVGDED